MSLVTRRQFAATLALAAGAPVAGQSPALRVLFIGNSYTYYNDLPGMVASIARSLPWQQVEPTMIATGGMTLQWHYAARKAAAAIDAGGWDFVILQEQSNLGGGSENGQSRMSPPTIFHESVRKFVPHIRAAGARPLLFMTWARRSRPAEQAFLTEAYRTIASQLGVPVAPVGLAWQAAQRLWPELDLFVADGSHPSPLGSYLTACVLYGSLTGRDPRGAAPTNGITSEAASKLQAVAAESI